MMMRLLFTGGGGAGNEALYRLLADRYEVHFADADIRAIAASIPADRRHAIPFAGDPSFPDEIASLSRRLGIDLIVPGVDEELRAMAAVRLAVPGIAILLPSPDIVDFALDKFETARVLGRAGLPVPHTVLASDPRSLGYPCIVKPRSGRGSRGVSVLGNQRQLEAYLELSGRPADQFVLQELLEGEEYTVMVAAGRDGGRAAVVPVLVEVKRGITLRARIAWPDDVIAACRKIHDTIGGSGAYNIQLMKTRDGRILPFEINPRISTTLCLSVAAGIDPFAIFFGAHCVIPEGKILELRRYWTNAIIEIEEPSA